MDQIRFHHFVEYKHSLVNMLYREVMAYEGGHDILHKDTKHNDIPHNDVVMLSVIHAECHYAECIT